MSENSKPKVLMIASACNPEGSGEFWLGWGWAELASKNFEVHIITTPEFREQIERLAPKYGIKPHFVSFPLIMGWLPLVAGRYGLWLRILAWHRRAAKMAATLHAKEEFSIVHQTTWHTFRVPFTSASLGIPSVWGPIAGGEYFPLGFYKYVGFTIFPESLRLLLNKISLALPSIQKSFRDADAIFVSNHTTLHFLPKFCLDRCAVVPPNSVRQEDEQAVHSLHIGGGDKFRILYVGYCLPTRVIPLVLHSLSRLKLKDCQFDIVGAGPALNLWKRQAARLELLDQVNFVGQVSRFELGAYYDKADVFVFPALRDSGGSALIEAMSKSVPIICLDWGGPAEMVDDSSGIKIAVTTPERTIQEFSAALLRLRDHPELRISLGRAGRARAMKLFTWETKRALLEETYATLLAHKPFRGPET